MDSAALEDDLCRPSNCYILTHSVELGSGQHQPKLPDPPYLSFLALKDPATPTIGTNPGLEAVDVQPVSHQLVFIARKLLETHQLSLFTACNLAALAAIDLAHLRHRYRGYDPSTPLSHQPHSLEASMRLSQASTPMPLKKERRLR